MDLARNGARSRLAAGKSATNGSPLEKISPMPEGPLLSREAFLTLAAAAGIDVSGEHGEELFTFVGDTLASLESLKDLDVAEAEPPIAFITPGE